MPEMFIVMFVNGSSVRPTHTTTLPSFPFLGRVENIQLFLPYLFVSKPAESRIRIRNGE